MMVVPLDYNKAEKILSASIFIAVVMSEYTNFFHVFGVMLVLTNLFTASLAKIFKKLPIKQFQALPSGSIPEETIVIIRADIAPLVLLPRRPSGGSKHGI